MIEISTEIGKRQRCTRHCSLNAVHNLVDDKNARLEKEREQFNYSIF